MGSHRTTNRRRRLAAALLVVAATITAGAAFATGPSAGAATATTEPPPAQDPFYAPPANLASLVNGSIIRWRPINAQVQFLGVTVSATSWQIAYKSLDAQNNPVTDVTTVVVPTAPYTGPASSRPVVSYQAAEDSTGSQCAPSYSLRTGSNILTSQEQSLIALGLMAGYAMDIPDYEGPGSAYLAGVQSAHAVLDGLRAVRQFYPAGVTPTTPLGMWGFSGGGHATAWAAELQHTYAPDLSIAGIAFGGAPVNLTNSFNKLNGGLYAAAMYAGIVGLSSAYPQWDIVDQLNAQGKDDVALASNACIIDFGTKMFFKNINNDTLMPNAIAQPQNQAIIALNNLGQHVPVAPIYDYYSASDEAVPTADSQALVAKYCSEGVTVDAQPVVLSEHVTLAITKSPDVLAWLGDRFAGKPAPSTC